MKKFALLTLLGVAFSSVVSSAGPQKGKPQPTIWAVTIENTLSDTTTATLIRSDGDTTFGGAYVSGEQGVQVGFSSGDPFYINFWPRADRGYRNVSFDYAPFAPVSPTPGGVAQPKGLTGEPGTLQDPLIGTRWRDGDIVVPIRSMEEGTTQCLEVYWRFIDAATGYTWRNLFNHSNVFSDSTESYAVVTRTDGSHWTIESDNTGRCIPNQPSVARIIRAENVKNKQVTTDYGTFMIPFRLTLEQQ